MLKQYQIAQHIMLFYVPDPLHMVFLLPTKRHSHPHRLLLCCFSHPMLTTPDTFSLPYLAYTFNGWIWRIRLGATQWQAIYFFAIIALTPSTVHSILQTLNKSIWTKVNWRHPNNTLLFCEERKHIILERENQKKLEERVYMSQVMKRQTGKYRG